VQVRARVSARAPVFVVSQNVPHTAAASCPHVRARSRNCQTDAGNVELSSTNANDDAKHLQACVGDCDTDAQCAVGLECFQRHAATGWKAVPGCTGDGKMDWDYCHKPMSGWCKEGNAGDGYTQSDSSIADWANDKQVGHGWRFCGVTVDECRAECLRMGGCAGIYLTKNNCCFPYRTRCIGTGCPGGCGGDSGHYHIVAQGIVLICFCPPPPPQGCGAACLRVQGAGGAILLWECNFLARISSNP